jgi:hypothetical protein
MSDQPGTPPPYPGQQPPQQPTWGSAYPPQQPPPGYGYQQPYAAPRPSHPKATTAMVLGIIGIAGGLACVLPLLVAPYAWIMGAHAVRDIDASGGQLGGRGEANTGKILGIIGTVLLALGLALAVLLLVLTLSVDDFWDDGSTY